MRNAISVTSTLLATALALATSALFVYINVLFSGVDSTIVVPLALLPVAFFLFAAYRNGARFTILWSFGMFGLCAGAFLIYGMDAGGLSFFLVGVASTLFIVAVCVVALAYRPQDGAMGALWRRGGEAAGNALARTKGSGSGGGSLPGAGINLMTALLVANLIISIMGMVV